MGWIDVNDKMPPEGLDVLLEVSGTYDTKVAQFADCGFYIGAWIIENKSGQGEWLIWDNCGEGSGHLINPHVRAWMPLPDHYRPEAAPGEDLKEHALFEDDPDWLYKGDAVYEQGNIDE